MLLIKAQGSILHIMQLLEDDSGADDKDDGDRELCDDQYFPEVDGLTACFEKAFKYDDRLKGGHEDGRVKTGEGAYYDRCDQQWQEHLPDKEVTKGKVQTRDPVDPG